jgi:hypothetical protein
MAANMIRRQLSAMSTNATFFSAVSSVLVAAAIVGLVGTAQAQQRPVAPQPATTAQQAPSATAPGAVPANPSAAPATIEGFRSARFGMTEDEVRRAIRTDFKVEDAAVARGENLVERTALLIVRVPDLLPTAGPAQISYVFGFSSKRLIAVNLAWAPSLGPTNTVEGLIATATTLRNHFFAQNFPAEGRIALGRMDEARILAFRVVDTANRVAAGILVGIDIEKGEAMKVEGIGEPILELRYVLNANEPDVFRIRPGQF